VQEDVARAIGHFNEAKTLFGIVPFHRGFSFRGRGSGPKP
jgi:hypothetical protein